MEAVYFLFLYGLVAKRTESILPTRSVDKSYYGDSEAGKKQHDADSEGWRTEPASSAEGMEKNAEKGMKKKRSAKSRREGRKGENIFKREPALSSEEAPASAEVNSERAADKNFVKNRAEILETGKELIKKNTELIKDLEDGLKSIKENKNEIGIKATTTEITKPGLSQAMSATAAKEDKSSGFTRTKDSIELHIPVGAVSNPADIAGAEVQSASVLGSRAPQPPLPIKGLSEPAPSKMVSSMKKLSELFFKSSMVTKSDVLTEEASAVLVDNNNRIKSIIGQLQKIYDTNSGVLKKFIDVGKDGMEARAEEKDKPKDVLKYQVIEVTESKK